MKNIKVVAFYRIAYVCRYLVLCAIKQTLVKSNIIILFIYTFTRMILCKPKAIKLYIKAGLKLWKSACTVVHRQTCISFNLFSLYVG